MEKITISVPEGIKFISEWNGFSLPQRPCIVNKQITGCGFTEYCITSPENIILCSPRKILLENKENQHPEVLYVKNELEPSLGVDKDITTQTTKITELQLDPSEITEKLVSMKDQVKQYILQQTIKCMPVKILVTYDSFRHVREAIGEGMGNYHVVIDEFQSIFTDSKFKSNTELEFLQYVKDLHRLCFVSATPMMDKYLGLLEEFKDLPYYELDWISQEPGRVNLPLIDPHPCRSILQEALAIVESYKQGEFDKFMYPGLHEVESRECVIYVNSVRNICDIVKKAALKFNEVNILCSRTPENEKKLRGLFKLKKGESAIGKVPLKGEPRKMFTLCTRTVYLGADFYSPCAKTFIFSDANIECLAVDITLDLPQIMGRQRDSDNPWKNSADLYFRSTRTQESPEKFMAKLKKKVERTESLLRSYSEVTDKHTLAETYQKLAQVFNYRDDYVAVNRHMGRDIVPVFNNLVMVSEMRSFEIQQIDYKDRWSVISSISGRGYRVGEESLRVIEAWKTFETIGTFVDKMKFLCSLELCMEEWGNLEKRLPLDFRSYLNTLGRERIRALSYQRSKLEAELSRLKGEDVEEIKERVYSIFQPGQKYTKACIKETFRQIYEGLGIKTTPKATDIGKYFEVKGINYVDPITGQKENGFNIIERL